MPGENAAPEALSGLSSNASKAGRAIAFIVTASLRTG
jgi:hypothetical protein